MFSKILIANRGEIAVRIIRACREMGISTVAIYSEADKDSLHVQLADESYCVGGNRVADSYLNMPAILTVAVESGAQAIHPGYGLLSENAKFVSLCELCNINFIGPSSEMIKLLGDKDNARKTMRAAGVPVTPGCDIVESVEQAKEEAEKIGFPLLIKARSGGGGKGIRRVDSMEQFEEAFLSASSEAQSAFGDGACYIEKFIHPVKHIEMQLLCDKYGNIVCLGERECSVQRKNQKMIEEKTTKTRNKFLKGVEKEAKRAPENKALDIFIKSQSEDKEIVKQALKARKNLPKETLKQLTEIRNNLASKIKVARQTTTFLLSSSAKHARPASIFVVPGVILGMVFAFIYNVIGDMRNG